MNLPSDFALRMALIFGDTGKDWIRQFTDTYRSCVDRWSLTRIEPIDDLSINFVAKAKRPDGTGVILKAGVPSKEFYSEVETLQIIDGRGYIRILDYAEDLTAMLLEEATPGSPLAEIADDEKATYIAARLLADSQHTPPPDHKLPHVSEWTAGLHKLKPHFDGTTGPFPPDLFDLAIDLFRELHARQDVDVVIHGDYHHWNILRANRAPTSRAPASLESADPASWLIIDPKGLVGPLGYEIGQFLHNFPINNQSSTAKGESMSRRLDIFSEVLEIPRLILLKWGLAQTVLSAWWSVEDGGSWEPTLECAQTLQQMLVHEMR